jgi:hypothetical protein
MQPLHTPEFRKLPKLPRITSPCTTIFIPLNQHALSDKKVFLLPNMCVISTTWFTMIRKNFIYSFASKSWHSDKLLRCALQQSGAHWLIPLYRLQGFQFLFTPFLMAISTLNFIRLHTKNMQTIWNINSSCALSSKPPNYRGRLLQNMKRLKWFNLAEIWA